MNIKVNVLMKHQIIDLTVFLMVNTNEGNYKYLEWTYLNRIIKSTSFLLLNIIDDINNKFHENS